MQSLLENINHLKKDDRCHQTIKFLYDYCFRIAIKSVTRKYGSDRHIFTCGDLTLDSIATDALTPLFIRSSDKDPIGLRRSLHLWENPIENENHADFFLHKVVWNRINQHITKILKENDPFFKKIHSSLRYYIDKNELNKISYFATIFVTDKNVKEINGNVISSEAFESLPEHLFLSKYEDILTNLLSYLEIETDFFPAIPLNALVRKIKFINRIEFESSTALETSDYIVDKLEIEAIIDKAYSIVCENLDRPNKKNSKLSPKIIHAFKSSLKNISNDMKDGGTSRGLYEYFSDHIDNPSKKEFYEKYHPQLNYLVSILKKCISDEIIEK